MSRLSILIFTLGLITSHGFSQDSGKQDLNLIKASHVEFHQQDSTLDYTVLIEPSGNFYFKRGWIYDSKFLGDKYRFNKKGVSTKDSVLIDTGQKLILDSRFDILIKDSTSFKNNYSYPYSFEPFINELRYSYILNNLIESELPQKPGEKILRLIIPNETSGTERDYYSIRVNFKKGSFVYKMGNFNKNLDYKLSKIDSIALSDKQIDKLVLRLEQVDFYGEEYFTEVGLDFYPTYLIEYFNGSDYYIFKKQLLSRNKADKEFNKLISELLMFKNKVMSDN